MFIINDDALGSPKKHTPRRIIIVKKQNKKVGVVRLRPIRNNPYRMKVKYFDGHHDIDLEMKIINNINNLYQKNDFLNTNLDYLTIDEKKELQIKVHSSKINKENLKKFK